MKTVFGSDATSRSLTSKTTYSIFKGLPMTSAFNSGGSSVVADTKLKALVISILMLFAAEDAANKDNSANPTQYVQWNMTGAAQSAFTATLNLPARLVQNATTNKYELVARNFVADYATFTPGTGDLADAVNLPEAVLEIAKGINYLEKQISPNIVIQQANQITVAENTDTGSIAINVNIPAEMVIDPATGGQEIEVFNYLFVTD
jgi:hypothetical protein